MTDKEKAIKAVCEECESYWYCYNKKQLCVYNRMYIKGLEEGRKEKETDIFDKWCREEGNECQFLEKLEKENEQLKKELESWKKRATDTYLEQ